MSYLVSPRRVSYMSDCLLRVLVEGVPRIYGVCKIRKSRDCWLCRKRIEKGDRAWREIMTSSNYRMYRICLKCWEEDTHEQARSSRGNPKGRQVCPVPKLRESQSANSAHRLLPALLRSKKAGTKALPPG